MKSIDHRPRVIVFGTRSCDQQILIYRKLDLLTAKLKDPVILVGGGKYWIRDAKTKKDIPTGADYHGEQWAYSRKHTVMRFPPDFDRYKSPECFYVRNRGMVEFAVQRRPAFAVGFWDGKSPGSKSIIDLCRKAGVKLRVVRY